MKSDNDSAIVAVLRETLKAVRIDGVDFTRVDPCGNIIEVVSVLDMPTYSYAKEELDPQFLLASPVSAV